ncbi:MAG: isoprenylcysteine carboxylmethyltransferase family protein [Phycisphaerales bacterium]|nr:isoprenylcysteine carboxylmethyltransferase family protein [Phycisphaerales bacterium]
MLDHPWNLVFLAGFAVYVGIRHVFERRVAHVETVVRRIDGTERALLVVVGIGSLVLPLLYVFTPLLAFADVERPGALPWCGAGLMILALWLFWRSHADLGPNWSVSLEVRRDHTLVDRGVYRRVRHPMYASIWLFAIAQGLLLSNWLAGWAAVATFAPLYLVRVPREEAMMIERFGDAYRAYMRRTGRLWPRRPRPAAPD